MDKSHTQWPPLFFTVRSSECKIHCNDSKCKKCMSYGAALQMVYTCWITCPPSWHIATSSKIKFLVSSQRRIQEGKAWPKNVRAVSLIYCGREDSSSQVVLLFGMKFGKELKENTVRDWVKAYTIQGRYLLLWCWRLATPGSLVCMCSMKMVSNTNLWDKRGYFFSTPSNARKGSHLLLVGCC